MRKTAAALAATLLLSLGAPARVASAGATVDLLFVGVNGSPIAATSEVSASPGDLLTMAVVMRNDQRLTLASFSLGYDLDGDDELDVMSAFQWSGTTITAGRAYFAPGSSVASTTSDFVGTFDGLALGLSPHRQLARASGAFAGGYQMGTVVWKVNAGVSTDGADIGVISGSASFYSTASPVPLLLNSASVNASVNAVPEPGTAALLGLGLLALASFRRRV